MKKLDIEKAKNGASVCLDDGTPAKILDFEYNANRIVFKFTTSNGTENIGYCFTDGYDKEGKQVLFMAPVIGYTVFYKKRDGSIFSRELRSCKELAEEERDRFKEVVQDGEAVSFFTLAKVELLDE